MFNKKGEGPALAKISAINPDLALQAQVNEYFQAALRLCATGNRAATSTSVAAGRTRTRICSASLYSAKEKRNAKNRKR